MKELNESLMDEAQSLSQQMSQYEQGQSDTVELNKNMSAYNALELRNEIKYGPKDDQKKGKKKEENRKPSKEMQAVLEEADGLEDFIGTLSFDSSDGVAFMSVAETLVDSLKRLVSRCDDYLNAKNPWSAYGKARYRIVSMMAERLDKDIVGLQEKAAIYLSLPDEEKRRIRSWPDLLNWERTVEFQDNKDGVKISNAGGNSSDVMVIEKDGEKLFFKQSQKLEKPDLREQFDKKMSAYYETLDEDVEDESPQYYQCVFLESFKTSFFKESGIGRAFADALFEFNSSGDGFADLKKLCGVLKMAPHDDIMVFIHRVDSISLDEQKKMIEKQAGDFFVSFRKDAVLSIVGHDTADISAGEDMAKRNVATSRLAALLGIGDMMPKSEMATIETAGKKMYGVVMGEAKGTNADSLLGSQVDPEFKGQRLEYSNEALRDLLDMQIFDALCGQIDRHTGNQMFMLEKESKDGKTRNVVKKVFGIDNDMSFGKINYAEIMDSNRAVLKRVEDSHGLFLPGMSRELAESILALDPALVNYEMLGLLNKKERLALLDRLRGIQEAIKKQMDYEKKHPEIPSKFIEKDQWGQFKSRLCEEAKSSKKNWNKLKDNTYVQPALLVGIKEL
ncbi:MAG: hypothetical protein K6B14_04600 [Lachnospiraceae bacterium]|nr:hypothetical protein [Lachnospiraceae bacterium]